MKITFKRYFILSVLFLLILSINLFSKEETDRITITDAKQLKGIWEAFYTYQEIPRQERIKTYIPPLPDIEEFESKEEHQKRVNDIKGVYERRIEGNIKNDINNEQKFKNTVFKIEFLYTPDDNDINKGLNIAKSYKHIEETKVQRTTLSTKYVKIPVAWLQEFQNTMMLFETRFVHDALSSPVPSTVPPFVQEWKIEENNLRIEEDIACLNFSLDKYDIEKKNFPLIFPPSQFPQGEKEWFYYIRKLNFGDYYMEMFEKSDFEKTEQWLIKFDNMPTSIPFSLNKAKMVRENYKNLILELEFQPTFAEKKVNSNTTYYTLQAKMVSATLKDGSKTIYVMANSIN